MLGNFYFKDVSNIKQNIIKQKELSDFQKNLIAL